MKDVTAVPDITVLRLGDLIGRPVTAVPVEVVKTLVLDIDHPLQPSVIGVFCWRCDAGDAREYIVRQADDPETRLGYARALLSEEGWTCGESGDFCPSCPPYGRGSR